VTSEIDTPELPEPVRPSGDGHVADAWADDPQGAVLTESIEDLADLDSTAMRSKRSSGVRAFIDWVVVVTVALLVAFVVKGFVLAHFVVEGSSMFATLETGDRVFVNKLSYRLHDPNRGDVIVLHQVSGATERDLIKRVIALPGETIEMTSCIVRISEPGESAPQVLTEPYLDPAVVTPTSCGGDFSPITIPADHVFVMGDNRAGSQDSRSLGPIDEDALVGRAFVVFWPRDNWQWL
jgi:signal peptidase I